jgi:hypothetical protein
LFLFVPVATTTVFEIYSFPVSDVKTNILFSFLISLMLSAMYSPPKLFACSYILIPRSIPDISCSPGKLHTLCAPVIVPPISFPKTILLNLYLLA